jgi:acetamidase/formamidase
MASHFFSPLEYHNTFGPHAAVFTLQPGDTITTTTLDAHGYDSIGAAVGQRSNPLTGPFAVHGAHPGDTLVVHILRLTPNRSYGFSYRDLRPNVVLPGMVPQLPPREAVRWLIDTQNNTAVPETPPATLPGLSIPLNPMLGCLGVAPDRGQSIISYNCGIFGGNIDSSRIAPGITLYLPVFNEGALLFLGDGHAAQSHGEIAGTGIEVTMEVELGIDLLPSKNISMPRGENPAQRFTLGIDRPLENALQAAVSEMLIWLQEDGLSMDDACQLLGQAARFELGNVISPAYSIACLLDKKTLKAPNIL